MGDILPGHGGRTDSDSLIAVAPVTWIILHYLVPRRLIVDACFLLSGVCQPALGHLAVSPRHDARVCAPAEPTWIYVHVASAAGFGTCVNR